MKKPQRILIALVAALGSHFTPLLAQNAPVALEAETGTSTSPPVTGATIGDWVVGTTTAAGTVPAATYITTKTDQAAYTGGASAPATAARVLTYSVTFPGPGLYDLYARIWVGPGGYSDDSFYYGSTFGTKSPTTSTDWQLINGLAAAGYTAGSTDIVDGGGSGGYSTTTTTPLWKWVNLSKFTGGVAFTVPAGSLTQTFQIGAREDGLYFDKFVFGDHDVYFTVANLDAGAQGSTKPPVTFVPTGPALATGKSKYLGSAYSAAQSLYFDKYWNAVTPENGGKWGSVEGTRGTFNWADLDSAYNRAAKIKGIFRMHNLIWGAQQPTWLKSLSQADQLTEIKNWYKAVADHFAGKKIDFIDVVNEPINTPPVASGGADSGGYLDALGGTGTTGYDWIITSFQLARQYFPTAKLMVNEYSLVNSSARTATYVTIINLLKTRNLIDGIGIQGHAFSTAGTPAATINANLATLAATGLPIYVTEYDTDGLTDAGQLAEYQRVFPLFWENPNVKGVTLWGFRIGHWRTAQGAYLINSDNSERSAMTWLRSYIQNTTLGTKAASAASAGVFLYPNPASDGSVALSLPTSLSQQPLEVALLNALGQTVLRQTLPASAGTVRSLPLAGVAKGLYTMRLSTGTGTFIQRLTIN